MIRSDPPEQPLELVVSGMSWAACAARIEKRLNMLDGVEASVNYATERAYVVSLGGHAPDELITAVRAAGYTASLPAAGAAPDADAGGGRPRAGGTGRRLRPGRAGRHRAGDGSVAAVQGVAVGESGTGTAGRGLGRMAASPRSPGWSAAGRNDHGHPGQPGHHRVAAVVGAGDAVRRGRHGGDEDAVRGHVRPGEPDDAVPRCDRGSYRGRADRPLPGIAGQAPGRFGPGGPGPAGCQDGRCPAGRDRAASGRGRTGVR